MTSCFNLSSDTHPHTSRTSSLISAELPSTRFAAYCASSGDNPVSTCSEASTSRWERNSRSRSSSRCRHRRHLTSHLLSRPHDLRHSPRHLFPLGFRLEQVLFARARQPVVLEFAITVRRCFPFRRNPALVLKPMQRWIQ